VLEELDPQHLLGARVDETELRPRPARVGVEQVRRGVHLREARVVHVACEAEQAVGAAAELLAVGRSVRPHEELEAHGAGGDLLRGAAGLHHALLDAGQRGRRGSGPAHAQAFSRLVLPLGEGRVAAHGGGVEVGPHGAARGRGILIRVVLPPRTEGEVIHSIGVRVAQVARGGIPFEGVGESAAADATPADVEPILVDLRRFRVAGVGEVVNHLRVFDDPVAAVGVLVNVDDWTGELGRDVSLTPPARKGTGVAGAMLGQGGRKEWHIGARCVAHVGPGLVDEVGSPVPVELGVRADSLLDLVDPGRTGVDLRGQGLAVHVGREVAVHVPARADADGPRPGWIGLVAVSHAGLEERLLVSLEVVVKVGHSIGAVPLSAEGGECGGVGGAR